MTTTAQAILQFATVLVIVAAVTVLALADKVDGAAALALIAALGGVHSSVLVGSTAFSRGFSAARLSPPPEKPVQP